MEIWGLLSFHRWGRNLGRLVRTGRVQVVVLMPEPFVGFYRLTSFKLQDISTIT